MSGGGGSTNSIEQLIGTRTGGPNQSVSADEIDRILTSANIVRQNYGVLADAVDGEINTDGLFVVHTSTQHDTISYVYGHLHNFLSSL